MTRSTIRLVSPYEKIAGRRWFRGNLHNHSLCDTRRTSPAEVRAIYQKMGYHFTAITDHDRRYPTLPWQPGEWNVDAPGEFVLLRGYEATYPGATHVNCVGCLPSQITARPGHESFLDEVHAAGAIAFLNHPFEWNDKPECVLDSPGLRKLDGLEVYSGARDTDNGLIEGRDSPCLATKLWDACLSAGLKLWGFANPDCHYFNPNLPDNPQNGFNVVLADALTREALLDALRRGRFYASTGIQVENIEIRNALVRIRSANATRIRLIGRHGQLLAAFDGPEAHYVAQGHEGYIRIELEGSFSPVSYPSKQCAWLQPIWLG